MRKFRLFFGCPGTGCVGLSSVQIGDFVELLSSIETIPVAFSFKAWSFEA